MAALVACHVCGEWERTCRDGVCARCIPTVVGCEFPVHPDDRHLLESVPWSLIIPHAEQAQRNHYQSLRQLAERGGLSLVELAAVLGDRPWRSYSTELALADVRLALTRHEAQLAAADGNLSPGGEEG